MSLEDKIDSLTNAIAQLQKTLVDTSATTAQLQKTLVDTSAKTVSAINDAMGLFDACNKITFGTKVTSESLLKKTAEEKVAADNKSVEEPEAEEESKKPTRRGRGRRSLKEIQEEGKRNNVPTFRDEKPAEKTTKSKPAAVSKTTGSAKEFYDTVAAYVNKFNPTIDEEQYEFCRDMVTKIQDILGVESLKKVTDANDALDDAWAAFSIMSTALNNRDDPIAAYEESVANHDGEEDNTSINL